MPGDGSAARGVSTDVLIEKVVHGNVLHRLCNTLGE